MATATHIPVLLTNAQIQSYTSQMVGFAVTTSYSNVGAPGLFFAGIISGGGGTNITIPPLGSSGCQYLSTVFTSNADLSGTGYTRQWVSGLTATYDATTNTYIDWKFNPITFPQNAADGGAGRYGYIAYAPSSTIVALATAGVTQGLNQCSNDASYPLVAILDLGQQVSVLNGSLIIQAPATGLIQWEGGG
jgi:hypothetical protein